MSRDHGFEKRMRKRLEQAGCYVLKLADAPAPFIGSPDLEESAARFTVKNPFDFLVLAPTFGSFLGEGGPCWALALELKSTAAPRFALGTVKPHQLSGLAAFPGESFVAVELRKVSRCFAVDLATLGYWEAETGKVSMNVGDLEARAIELPRNTTGRERLDYYDVGPLLGTGQTVDQATIGECV